MAANPRVYLVLQDDKGDRAVHTVRPFRSSWSTAMMQEFIDLYSPRLDAVIDAQIIDVWYETELDLPGGLKGAPVDANGMEDCALLFFDAPTYAPISARIPAISSGLVNSDGTLDLADQGLADYAAALDTGITVSGQGVQPIGETGERYGALITARHSKSQAQGLTLLPGDYTASPTVQIDLSIAWIAYLLGWLRIGNADQTWQGDETEIATARGQVRAFLAYLADRIENPPGYFILDSSVLDGVDVLA